MPQNVKVGRERVKLKSSSLGVSGWRGHELIGEGLYWHGAEPPENASIVDIRGVRCVHNPQLGLVQWAGAIAPALR